MSSLGNKITTSLHGRRVGLQSMSTGQSGNSRGALVEFLIGPADFRVETTTAETTSTNLEAYGHTILVGTSVASTPVFTLDPPIPGVRKVITFGSTDSALYLKMSSGVAISGTSLGNTGATAIRSSGGGIVELIGLTTALFGALTQSSSAINATEYQATT